MATKKIKKVEVEMEEIENESEEKEVEVVKSPISLNSNEIEKFEKQFQTEFKIGYDYIKPKIDEWGLRLKLYNNQKRDKEAIGDPLLFTIMQVVLATLYSDKLVSDFQPVEEGDEETADTLNRLLEHDYDKMMMSQSTYDWDWDALFFGRSYLLMMDFDREMMIPLPEVLNPMVCIRDPKAKSMNGLLKRKGGARYFGWEGTMGYSDMEESGLYDMSKVDSNKMCAGRDSLLTADAQARDDAQNRQTSEKENEGLGDDNKEVAVYFWFTMFKKKRIFAIFTQDKKKLIRYVELPKRFKNCIPIIDRTIYPTSHDWDGVSVPDLCEDKQRGRAVLGNFGMKIAKKEAQPMYLFNGTKITNKADLRVGFNKFIEVAGDVNGAMSEVPSSGIKSSLDYVMGFLSMAAEKATAATEMKQGLGMGKTASAAESNAAMASTETRYSLAAKIFGWSEAQFCRWYYFLYKEYFNGEIDDKVIRINGALGYQWRRLTPENFDNEYDPDVKVESKYLIEQRNKKELIGFTNFLNLANLRPNTNKNYALREYGKLCGVPKKVVDNVVMKTPDELVAEEENNMIMDGEVTPVHDFDNDYEHMLIHNKLADDYVDKRPHIQAHINNMAIKAKKEMEAREKAKLENGGVPVEGENPAIQEGKNLQSMMTKTSGNMAESNNYPS